MKQPDKLKRHFLLIVIIISFLLFFFGQLMMYPILTFCQANISDAGTVFLLEYSICLGVWLLTMLYCRIAEKETFNSFKSARRGGRKGNTLKNLFIGLVIGFALNGVSALAAFLHKDLAFSFSSFDILYLSFGLLVVFIQSGSEELLTRGYMYSVIESRYGAVFAIIINSLFFAILHGANHGITFLAILHLFTSAVMMSLFVWRYDSLWMAMGMHTAWNYTQSLLLGLPNSGNVSEKSLLHLDAASDSMLYSTAFGLEGGIPASIIELLIIVFILLGAMRKDQEL